MHVLNTRMCKFRNIMDITGKKYVMSIVIVFIFIPFITYSCNGNTTYFGEIVNFRHNE